MTDFMDIASITVPIVSIVKQPYEVGGSLSRAFAGNLRATVRWQKRVWKAVTGLMLESTAETLEAAIANGAQVTASGLFLNGGSLTVTVTQEDSSGQDYISVATSDGNSFMRPLALTIREV